MAAPVASQTENVLVALLSHEHFDFYEFFRCIEEHPEALAQADDNGMLPLHMLLVSRHSSILRASIKVTLLMIEAYPAALQHPDQHGLLPLHLECSHLCRYIILNKCIELYVESLAKMDEGGDLPLHVLLRNTSMPGPSAFNSAKPAALMMMGIYPAALQRHDHIGQLPLHIESGNQCRTIIIERCIELYPEALEKTCNRDGYLPLHFSLWNKRSTIDTTMMMMEKYPAALKHRVGDYGHYLPLHIECSVQCRSTIIAKCIELYRDALSLATDQGDLPLHVMLGNRSSSIEAALSIIKHYPAAVLHQNMFGSLPLHIEIYNQLRLPIIRHLAELYPQSLYTLSSHSSCSPLSAILGIMLSREHPDAYRTLPVFDLLLKPYGLFLPSPIVAQVNDRLWLIHDNVARRILLNHIRDDMLSAAFVLEKCELNWKPRSSMMHLCLLLQLKLKSMPAGNHEGDKQINVVTR
jgi:ankyrin repeat protein